MRLKRNGILQFKFEIYSILFGTLTITNVQNCPPPPPPPKQQYLMALNNEFFLPNLYLPNAFYIYSSNAPNAPNALICTTIKKFGTPKDEGVTSDLKCVCVGGGGWCDFH